MPWIQLEPDLSVNFSDQTTSYLDKLVPVTTGLRVTTLKVLSLSTPSLMSLERNLKVAIAFKDFKLHTPSVVVPDLVWEHSLFQRSEKSIQIDR